MIRLLGVILRSTSSAFRTRRHLLLENLALRQQLSVFLATAQLFMGPILCEVFAKHGATMISSTDPLLIISPHPHQKPLMPVNSNPVATHA